MRRGWFSFYFIAWFITAYPRTSKALVLLVVSAILVAIFWGAR